MLERIREDHRMLLQLCGRIRLLLAPGHAIDHGTLAGIRWRLARLLAGHLAYLGAYVFGPLLKATGGADRDDVGKLRARTGTLTMAYRAHRESFVTTIAADTEQYRRETLLLLDGLEDLIADEQELLYPLIARLPGGDGPYDDRFQNTAVEDW